MKSKENPSKELQEKWHKDPKNWIWGIFYFNKDDNRIFPPKRFKYFGWTVNFANTTSIVVLVALVLTLILISRLLATF